jgi:hypothetical protein
MNPAVFASFQLFIVFCSFVRGNQMFLISGRVTDVEFNFQDGDVTYYAIVALDGQRIRIISSSVPVDTLSEIVVAVESRLHDGSYIAIACYVRGKNVFADGWDLTTIFLINFFVGIGLFFLIVDARSESQIWQTGLALFSLGFGIFAISRYKQFHDAKAAILRALQTKPEGADIPTAIVGNKLIKG